MEPETDALDELHLATKKLKTMLQEAAAENIPEIKELCEAQVRHTHVNAMTTWRHTHVSANARTSTRACVRKSVHAQNRARARARLCAGRAPAEEDPEAAGEAAEVLSDDPAAHTTTDSHGCGSSSGEGDVEPCSPPPPIVEGPPGWWRVGAMVRLRACEGAYFPVGGWAWVMGYGPQTPGGPPSYVLHVSGGNSYVGHTTAHPVPQGRLVLAVQGMGRMHDP